MGIWLQRVDKTRYLVTLGCLLSRKTGWGIDQWTRMDQSREHTKISFDYFQILKWMLQTVRAENADKKNGVICLVSMFSPWVMVIKFSKKVHFWNFVLPSAKNLSLSKQFTYFRLKGLVTYFQKMVLFIMLWLTVQRY